MRYDLRFEHFKQTVNCFAVANDVPSVEICFIDDALSQIIEGKVEVTGYPSLEFVYNLAIQIKEEKFSSEQAMS